MGVVLFENFILLAWFAGDFFDAPVSNVEAVFEEEESLQKMALLEKSDESSSFQLSRRFQLVVLGVCTASRFLSTARQSAGRRLEPGRFPSSGRAIVAVDACRVTRSFVE